MRCVDDLRIHIVTEVVHLFMVDIHMCAPGKHALVNITPTLKPLSGTCIQDAIDCGATYLGSKCSCCLRTLAAADVILMGISTELDGAIWLL